MRETTDHYNEQQIINHRVPHVSLELSHSLCHIKGNPVVLTTASLHTDVENEEIKKITEGSLKKKKSREEVSVPSGSCGLVRGEESAWCVILKDWIV